MNLLELFAGAGGAAIGLKAAGYDGLHYEWDVDAHATLTAAGFHGYRIDVRKARWQGWGNYYGQPHLLWASPPCQAFSQAGDRLGAKDERNGWPWTLDAIDGARPTWVVCENVPGLCQHTTATCGDPMQCAGCYWEQWVLPEFRKRFAWVGVWKLNAADYGVPQTRRRVFLVAGPHAIGAPAPTHAHSSMTRTLFGELQPWVSMGQALGLVGTLDGGRNSDNNPQQERVRTTDEPAPTLGGMGNQMLVNPKHAGDTRNYRDLTNEPSTTIPASASGNAGPWVLRPSPCVTATEYKGLSANPRQDMNRATDALFLGTGRRRLTTLECAALQDFPVGLCPVCYCEAGGTHGKARDSTAIQDVRVLRDQLQQEAAQQWEAGGEHALQQAQVLQPRVCGQAQRPSTTAAGGGLGSARPAPPRARVLRQVRQPERRGAPQGRELAEQQGGEPGEAVPLVPHEGAQPQCTVHSGGLPQHGDLDQREAEHRRARDVQQALPALEEVGRPVGGEGQPAHTCRACGRVGQVYDYPFHGTKKQRYRQVGNAVPPALAEAIARCIPPE